MIRPVASLVTYARDLPRVNLGRNGRFGKDMVISRLIRNQTKRIEQAADALDEKRDENSYYVLLIELSLLLRTSEVVLDQAQREFGEGTGVWDLDKKQFESFQEQISVFALSEIQKKRLELLADQVAKTDV